MFRHVGKKLKVLAVTLCWIGILGSAAAGVLLYVYRVLPLLTCILIGVGGALVIWISSWMMYAVGDTHARIEVLQEKLVPKPAYMNYLSENAPRLEKCEICGKTTDVFSAKIVDNMGTRYRKVCRDCFQANHFEPAE